MARRGASARSLQLPARPRPEPLTRRGGRAPPDDRGVIRLVWPGLAGRGEEAAVVPVALPVGQEDAHRGTACHAERLPRRRSILRAGAVAGLDRFQDRVEDPGIVAGQERQRQRQLFWVEGR